jgi:hypothetical protein
MKMPTHIVTNQLITSRLSETDVLSRISANPNDIIIVSGTLVEGIGNAHSDIDVYVFGEAKPTRSQLNTHNFVREENGAIRSFYDYIDNEGLGLDVEYFSLSELDGILARMHDLYERARSRTKYFFPSLSWAEDDLIHKLLVGTPVQGQEEFATILRKLDRDKYLFLKYRNKTGSYPEFKDVMGAWFSDDLDTCLFNMREYVIAQTMGFVHLNGITNWKQKWFTQNIKRVRPEHRALTDQVWAWLTQEQQTVPAKQQAIHEACGLLDNLYAASRALLASNPAAYDVDEAIELTRKELAAEPIQDPQTIDEYEHRLSIFGASQYRMGDFFVRLTGPRA